MNKQFLKAGMLGLLVAGWLSQAAMAQSDPTGKRRVTSTYAITNATVFKAPGGIKLDKLNVVFIV